MNVTIVEQTREERRAMFMKLTKAELVEMLMNNQDILKNTQPQYISMPSGQGCVCPAGAEQSCGASFCPRRGSPYFTTNMGASNSAPS